MKGKTIVITGAGMGLGYATALELAAKGANLALVDYNQEALNRIGKELGQRFPEVKAITILADVSSEKAVKAYVEKTVATFDRIDGFYNNAGIEGKQASITEYDVDVFKKVIDINLMGVYYGLRYVIPVMQKQKYGRIVNVASVGGIRGVLHQTPYVASKHAVSGMTKNAPWSMAKTGFLQTP